MIKKEQHPQGVLLFFGLCDRFGCKAICTLVKTYIVAL
jgi:hypothetical protein